MHRRLFRRVLRLVPQRPICLAAFFAAVDHLLIARLFRHRHAFGASEEEPELVLDGTAIPANRQFAGFRFRSVERRFPPERFLLNLRWRRIALLILTEFNQYH